MNTRFLKALVSSQRKAQVVGQILCLLVVAAIFVVSPFVSLAACGQQNNAQKVQAQNNKTLRAAAQKTSDTVQIVGVVDTFTAGSPAPDALNKSTVDATQLPAGTKLAGNVLLKTATLNDVKAGAWVMMTQNGVTYAATFFGCNNQIKVCEMWPAEQPVASSNGNATLTKTGTKIFIDQNKLGLLPSTVA